MRILILQFVSGVRGRTAPRFEPSLGTLISLLKQRGHDPSLLGVSRVDLAAVKTALARALPQLIYADISAVCTDVARRTLEHIQQHEFIPVVAGGAHATLDPQAALSMPGVQAAAVGEPDASLVTYLERMKDPAISQIVMGVWLRDESGLARPELPPLVEDLDSLPVPDRELFGYEEYVRATGELEIAVARGCPQSCAYCVYPATEALYTGRGQWHRLRTPDGVLAEIDDLRRRYAEARIIGFLDHAFALDSEWLSSFLDAYTQRCALPFRCHLRANASDGGVVGKLAGAGCKLVDVELISASDFIRNEMFEMKLGREQIVATFDALREAELPARVIVYLGAPYESEASLDNTLALLRSLQPAVVDVRPYYPWPGTRAAQVSQENGWIHSRGEEQYHHDRNGIDMPACRPARVHEYIKRFRHEFPTALDEPWWRRWSFASRSALEQFFQKRR